MERVFRITNGRKETGPLIDQNGHMASGRGELEGGQKGTALPLSREDTTVGLVHYDWEARQQRNHELQHLRPRPYREAPVLSTGCAPPDE